MTVKSYSSSLVPDSDFSNGIIYVTVKKVETIVHEEPYLEYNLGGDAHAECVYNALKHQKGELMGVDIRDIIKSVRQRYLEYEWRNPK